MATTRSRPSGRESARPATGDAITEHLPKIYGISIAGVIVVVAFLALTSTGHVIDAATQHFMLYYAGVFTLIALCTSVALGLISTDRIVLGPGHRVFSQSVHRAVSFGAVGFLVIHIVTEILAQRAHIIDSVVPFLSPFRTFYIGLGTIASDLILLLVITGILRKRFTAAHKAWRWKAIHYTAYVSFGFGIWHGLLGGRPGKPYVDWSYGAIGAAALLGLAVRILANSLRPRETLSAPAVDERAGAASAASSLKVMAQLGGTMRMLSAGRQDTGPGTITAEVLPAYTVAGELPAAGNGQVAYEPGYEGPPRYIGAQQPRAATGPMPQMGRPGTGPMPRPGTGPMPRTASGPMPRAATGPMPLMGRPGTGPMPRPGTGPIPRAASGPMPRAATGPMPQMGRPGTGPMPYPNQGNGQRQGPPPRAGGPPRTATGPMPQAGTPHGRASGPEIDPRGQQQDWRGAQPQGQPAPRQGGAARHGRGSRHAQDGNRRPRYGGDNPR